MRSVRGEFGGRVSIACQALSRGVGGSGGVEIVQDFVDPLVSRGGSELGFGDG